MWIVADSAPPRARHRPPVVSRPARPWTRGEAGVLANTDEGGGNWRLRLGLPQWRRAAPGQFVMLGPASDAIPRSDPLLPRPMAVFRSGTQQGVPWFEVFYRVVGRGTALLAACQPGDWLRYLGPLGAPFVPPRRPGCALLVGGGTGIASLYQLAIACAARGSVRVLLGARHRAALMAAEDFAALPGVDTSFATEDGSAGHRGRVTELLERVLEVPTEVPAKVYACGPTPMMQRVAALARAAGLDCFVSLEGPMACGIGLCLGCAVPRAGGGFALLCRDGPVFRADALAWGDAT